VKTVSFIDFNLEWYKNRIDYYFDQKANGKVNNEIIYEAKVLHKFLEDIKDEGYLSTYNLFQEKLQATKKLEQFIHENHKKPFTIAQKSLLESELQYGQAEIPLDEYLQSLSEQTQNTTQGDHNNAIYEEIYNFSKWVYSSISPNTAVIFLLRDTLLPYFAFRYWNRDATITPIPLLIGRKFLGQFGNGDYIYNKISNAVYTSLYNNPVHFQNGVVELIKEYLQSNQELKSSLQKVLSKIKQNSICVVESGTHGTMPLLLKAVDERVNSIKLYTTLPCLYNAWENVYYTKHYEKLRIFETLRCQDLLFTLSSIKGDTFCVKEVSNSMIKQEAIIELSHWKRYILGNVE